MFLMLAEVSEVQRKKLRRVAMEMMERKGIKRADI